MTRPLTPLNKTPQGNNWTWPDLFLILVVIAVILVIIKTAANFEGAYNQNLKIDTSIIVLPSYTAQTILRVASAYFLSLSFTIVYAYSAYIYPRAALILIPVLDILQSIPVLSFLPSVVLGLVSLFPGQRIGVELAAILLLFTGMTWNMVFSFYQSLCSIPRELKEATQVYHLNAWQKFWQLELPSGAIGLIWNSVMSVAGGWFFLIQIESFTLGNNNFQLPGLGSYLKTAATKSDYGAIGWGLLVLVGVIVGIDILIWRPLIAWAEKFKFQMLEAENIPHSSVLNFLRKSPTLQVFSTKFTNLTDRLESQIIRSFPRHTPSKNQGKITIIQWVNWLFLSGLALIVLWGTWEAIMLLKMMHLRDWQTIIVGTILTTLRVTCALILSLLWTVPVGVTIGRNLELAKILQPLVQIAASVPATALFPILLLFLAKIGGGLQIGSVILMMLGTMWYILFNVIAGTQAIPAELFEVAKIYKLSRWQQWKTLILPGIFPYLITGIITAVGGAWNASIISEYVEFQGTPLITNGLGSIISQSSISANYPVLFAATAVMSFLVVLTNRLVWRPLYRLAQEKYQLLI